MVHREMKIWALVSALAWLEVGCARTVVLSQDVGTGSDVGAGRDAPSVMATAQTYIISAYDIPNGADARNRMPGLNLDGVVSDGSGSDCVGVTPDFTSLTGEAGIDNQLVGILASVFSSGFSFDLDRAANHSVSSGAQLVALRISDVDSLTTDASVMVELFLVRPADCARDICAVGSVLSDAAWIQRASAVTPPVEASILRGQVRAEIPTFAIAFSNDLVDGSLTLRTATVQASISPAGLSDGTITGTLSIRDVLDFSESIWPGVEVTIDPIIRRTADLDPTPGMPNECQAISAGIGFRAVSARSVTR